MENRKFERRTSASEVRYLSILERRSVVSRRRVDKMSLEVKLNRLYFKVGLLGVTISYICWLSEVWKASFIN